MSYSCLLHEVLAGLLPGGELYKIMVDGDLDKFNQAVGQNWQQIYDMVIESKDYRNPYKTVLLDDLEKDYGESKNENLSEETRRMNLASRMYEKYPQKSEDTVTQILHDAGLTTVNVFQNDPAVNPGLFTDQAFQMVAGGNTAYAGNEGAYAGVSGGYYLVNTPLGYQQPNYLSVAGNMYAGGLNQNAGLFESQTFIPLEYETPDEDYWPGVCFVCNDVTRDGSGYITGFVYADVPSELKYTLEKLLLRNLPWHQWAAMFINYT